MTLSEYKMGLGEKLRTSPKKGSQNCDLMIQVTILMGGCHDRMERVGQGVKWGFVVVAV